MRKLFLRSRFFYLFILFVWSSFYSLGQNCPTDKGYETQSVSLSDQLGNLKDYIDIGFCKQVSVNQKEQEIFAIIKKKKPVLNEDIVVSFEITFKTKSQKDVVMKGTPEFKKDQFIRKGWGSDANQDMQLIIDAAFCYPCDTIDIISASLDDISIQINTGIMKDSVLKRELKSAPAAVNTNPNTNTDSVPAKLGAGDKFGAPPEPTQPKLPFDIEEYKMKVNDKIQDFQKNIQTLANSKSRLLIDNTIIQTLRLFIHNGDDITIEVSSKGKKAPRLLPVPQYLRNLTVLKYSRVEITWTKVFIADNFYKGADGNYYATVTFDQVFRGINDNVQVYGDITRKKIEIQLKTYMKNDQLSWDIFLGNTTVEQTSDF